MINNKNFNKSKGGKFLKVMCPRCRANYVVFGKSATWVKCNKCNYLLLKPQGGKTKIRALIKEVYND